MKFLVLALTSIAAVSAASLNVPTSSITVSKNGTLVSSSIDCKCTMTPADKNGEDSTDCLCYNKKSGKEDTTHQCEIVLDAIFSFCTRHHNVRSEWSHCVQDRCVYKPLKH
ncbi:hypothetical protein BDF14DRAFT_1781241 [Spinellus fusiger]|nr:hypothetical protein BDF14DRAFT_1781241 [Spinellus fusiger]